MDQGAVGGARTGAIFGPGAMKKACSTCEKWKGNNPDYNPCVGKHFLGGCPGKPDANDVLTHRAFVCPFWEARQETAYRDKSAINAIIDKLA